MLTDFIYYDLKVAALIAVFYLFYMLLLARETTHTLNRMILLSAIVLSAALPLCVITIHKTSPTASPLPPPKEGVAEWITKDPSTSSFGGSKGEADKGEALAVVLLTGSLVCMLRLVRGYRKLNRMILSGERHTLPSGIRVSVVDAPIAPFSWMQTIVLSREDWNVPPSQEGAGDGSAILAHEEAHVRLRHSYDVVVVEVLTALQWFNPVVWFMRQELRILHEYEADASVLSLGFNESQYIHLLMQKAMGIQACALANGIHTPKTKKRILMMLKTKSRRTAWLKALYIVPIVLISLAMTAKTVVDYEASSTEGVQEPMVRMFNDTIHGRGKCYQILNTPGLTLIKNGKEDAVPGGRNIALEVAKTTIMLDGVKFDENSLPTLPITALREVHLDWVKPGRFIANLVTAKPMRYTTTISDRDFIAYVSQHKAAGVDENALGQMMLNSAGSVSRAHMLHVIRAYGSKKNKLFIVDGKEVSQEEFEQLKPEAIASVTVMDVGPARKVFGEKGQYGATVVKTNQQVSDAPQQVDGKVFNVCEELPRFPGGEAKLMEFLMRNIKYPEIAKENGVQGRVIVRFIVEKDGSLTNAEVLENPKKSGASMVVVTANMPEKERQDAEAHNAGVKAMRDEAIRIVNSMPKWEPGKQKGKNVRCHFVIPVTFRLN